MRHHSTKSHLFLDVSLAAVLIILGLTLLFFIQALALQSRLYTYLHQRMGLPLVSEVGGRISNIYVKQGDYVHTGDPLVQLDSRDLSMKQRLLEARIHFTELHATERARLAALYRQLEETRVDMNRLTITAPVDGMLVSFAALRINDILYPGTLLGTVIPNSDGYDKEGNVYEKTQR